MNPGGADGLAELDARLAAHREAIAHLAGQAKARIDERTEELQHRVEPPRRVEPVREPPPLPGDDAAWDESPVAAAPAADAFATVATDDEGIPMWDDGT